MNKSHANSSNPIYCVTGTKPSQILESQCAKETKELGNNDS